jgi:glucose-1-phosphate cytidylyltransferase
VQTTTTLTISEEAARSAQVLSTEPELGVRTSAELGWLLSLDLSGRYTIFRSAGQSVQHCSLLKSMKELRQRMVTLILCGGKGTRAYPHTKQVPKPLMRIGNEPILRHLMEIYAGQGFRDFLLAGGYLVDLLKDFRSELPPEWNVEVIDTGGETGTGGRIARCSHLLGSRFLVTYGDGLGNVDLRSLIDFHVSHQGLATVTAVPLPSPYGTMQWDKSNRVSRFIEKPTLSDHWINAGFFVFDSEVFEHWSGDDLEREVLPGLSREHHLYAFQHQGFWRSMDTYKDALELGALLNGGGAPWMTLRESPS